MQDFEVEFKVLGEFPKYLKPQVTDKIKIVKEKLNADDDSLSEIILSVSISSESELTAEYYARKTLSRFLSFYSVTTLNHIRILDDYNEPITIRSIKDGKKELHYPTAYSLEEYEQQFFLDHVLPYYDIILKKGNEYLKIASEYLWRGRFEESVEVCMINCFIALEALFMRTKDNTELSYRLSNRIAVLLSENSDERLKLRKQFRDLYNLRSKIVHGEPTDLGLDDYENIFSITRNAVLRFLELSKKYENHDKIIDLLDDAMIDNQTLVSINKESTLLIKKIEEAHDKNLRKI